MYWRRKWQPTPVFLLGESHGWGSLVGFRLWGHTESDTTEQLHFHFHALEREMATHSSILAWRITGTEEPGGLPSTGLCLENPRDGGAWWAAAYGVTQSWTRLK